jgi:hypothetical protein
MLVTLAEAVEQVSRDRRPVARLLDSLDDTTDRAGRRLAGGPAGAEPPCFARWRRVLTSVRRDVEHGRVRSVSGLSHEARRLELQLDRGTPVVART